MCGWPFQLDASVSPLHADLTSRPCGLSSCKVVDDAVVKCPPHADGSPAVTRTSKSPSLMERSDTSNVPMTKIDDTVVKRPPHPDESPAMARTWKTLSSMEWSDTSNVPTAEINDVVVKRPPRPDELPAMA